MTDRALMQQALEALESCTPGDTTTGHVIWPSYDEMIAQARKSNVEAAITALQERLAQPEPVQFKCTVVDDDHPDGVPLSKWGRHPDQEPFCYHDGRNIVGKEYADHSDVFPLYTSPNPEQQKPVRFNCTVIDDAHLNGVPLSQWGKQHEMQPCAGRNCGSIDPNLHSAECFEEYEKATGMNQRKPLTDEQIEELCWTELDRRLLSFARAIEAAHGIGEKRDRSAN